MRSTLLLPSLSNIFNTNPLHPSPSNMVVRPYFTPDRHVLPFDKVIELERIDDWTFRSIVKAYSPTGGENGTYGGHVFAQAAWAAAQTVQPGYLIHVGSDMDAGYVAWLADEGD